MDMLTIGRLARRTGVPVRTLRFWSDAGAIPPAGRSATGYRLYDAGSVARVELLCTLRELGFGLDDARRVLDGRTTVAEVADAHVAAIDVRIRELRVSRAVLSTVAKRGSTPEETHLMNRLARLSAAERLHIVDEFKREVFGPLDLDPDLRDRLAAYRIDLPDDPSADQVDAWVELADLVSDAGWRDRMRRWLELTGPEAGSLWWARHVTQAVAEARERDADPAGLVSELFGDADRSVLLASLEAGIEAEAERYRLLVARVRGRQSAPDASGDLAWLAVALRAAAETSSP